ncbi:2-OXOGLUTARATE DEHYDROGENASE [Salix purpurea]|uniref:2-oxoglutarate dehydrogenase, mitochondrial n=1 Tax=Salix purpurea TaxID=77065 RepID=A0A9Q0Z1E9_SALPP|nr:2-OXOGLUTARATE DEHYDROGENASE [Salix purpurea]
MQTLHLSPPAVPLSRLTDNVLDGTSSARIEELQKAWEVDPDSVDESGDNFFRNFGGQTATSTGVTGQTRQENAEIVWCQEEPMNMGASSYIAPRLCTDMKATGRGSWEDIKFVGRGPSASTATGFAQAVLAVADDKWRGGRLYTGIMDDRRFAGWSDTAVEVKLIRYNLIDGTTVANSMWGGVNFPATSRFLRYWACDIVGPTGCVD